MKLLNKTKQTVIAENIVEARSFMQKTVGLLGTKNPTAMLFRTRFGIHTFGMQYPIDVLVLSNKNKVVKIKHSLKPNHVYFWNPKFDQVIELPEGTIKKTKTGRSDLVSLEV